MSLKAFCDNHPERVAVATVLALRSEPGFRPFPAASFVTATARDVCDQCVRELAQLGVIAPERSDPRG